MFHDLLILIIIFCILIIIFEFLWLFLLSTRRQRQAKYYKDSQNKITAMLNSLVYTTSPSGMQAEIEGIKKFVGKDEIRIDIITSILFEILSVGFPEEESDKIESYVKVFKALKAEEFYLKKIKSGNNLDKAFACKKLSQFGSEEALTHIRKLSGSKDRDLAYNAIMSLSLLGDEEGIYTLLCKRTEKLFYSHRIILEIIDGYTGDIVSLALRILNDPRSTDYIKSAVIKGISKYKLKEFSDIFVKELRNKNPNVKIAAIRALGFFEDPEYEQDLIIAAHDKDWTVRAAAVKSLGNINTVNSKEMLVKATSDQEWWVRNNAATALIFMEDGLDYARQILDGYDRYAADAVKYAIFKNYKLD